ncbi:urate hydroxylase PuuD [Terricaulis sp.]|uniref:urate hydroxylase PuuD n=1 Tax=Terricaulis sp. TaxID=2768686 RepID=UPI003782E8C5
MDKLLGNIRIVSWTGLVLGLLFLVFVAMGAYGYEFGHPSLSEALLRWLHVLSGIMWIGHLYYFNFTQIPNAPKIAPEHRGPAIAKVIAPAALFWFRWGAVATLVTGLLLAGVRGYIWVALSLDLFDPAGAFHDVGATFIGVGMWLAIIMFLNVWVIIWPNQQRALNIDNKYPDLDQAAKDKAAKTAMLFSRTNTLLSIPMLVAMTAAQTFMQG